MILMPGSCHVHVFLLCLEQDDRSKWEKQELTPITKHVIITHMHSGTEETLPANIPPKNACNGVS